jgi:hypothetical protein
MDNEPRGRAKCERKSRQHAPTPEFLCFICWTVDTHKILLVKRTMARCDLTAGEAGNTIDVVIFKNPLACSVRSPDPHRSVTTGRCDPTTL